jgi:hypothetical protein
MKKLALLLGSCAALLVLAFPWLVAAQSMVGCWETAADAPDHRRICINADSTIRLTTLRSRSGGRCDAYPSVRADISAGTVRFAVAPGRGNCVSSSGMAVDSVPGGFTCTLSGNRFLACRTTWETYEPIFETYVRQ